MTHTGERSLSLEIIAVDSGFLVDIFGRPPAEGAEVSLPSGGTLRYVTTIAPRGAWPGASELVQLAISFGSGVAAQLAASWLYDRLKKKGVTSIRIERRTVELTPEGIARAIEEVAEIEH
jgi:hypothetical protein